MFKSDVKIANYQNVPIDPPIQVEDYIEVLRTNWEADLGANPKSRITVTLKIGP